VAAVFDPGAVHNSFAILNYPRLNPPQQARITQPSVAHEPRLS
jgi:hypothetical protein